MNVGRNYNGPKVLGLTLLLNQERTRTVIENDKQLIKKFNTHFKLPPSTVMY